LCAIRNNETIAIPLYLFRNGFIFHDLVFYFFMPADTLNSALDHDELPICNCITAFGSLTLRENPTESAVITSGMTTFPRMNQGFVD
jgi:hypothetical protein